MRHSKTMVLALCLTGNALAEPGPPVIEIKPKKVEVKDIVQPVKIEKQTRLDPTDLAGLAAVVAGRWRCTGGKLRATNTTKLELGKRWLVDVFDLPIGDKKHQHAAYTRFDTKGGWQRVTFDSTGVMRVGVSDGMKGGKLTWTMTEPQTGAQVRDHVDFSDPKNVKLWTETTADQGKSWSKVLDLTCKK
ncbi:MAG TPA: hypothetical protein VIU61_18440 [Kofleriaceae bacterium]